MSVIETIASKHLGKAGDGSVVKPYVTPLSIDKTLLVAVPRHLNRTQYGIVESRMNFKGLDIWNCYEVSFLLANGLPVSGMIRFSYASNTPNIVESKSLKLYLNSYNMNRFNTVNVRDAINIVIRRFMNDVSKCVGGDVDAVFMQNEAQQSVHSLFQYDRLETALRTYEMVFDDYNESPDILEPAPSLEKEIHVMSSLLRSNCRVTNQPDWGDVYIHMKGDAVPTYESLLKYIVSMRRENHFHEEICECIYTRLYDIFKPDNLSVMCLYTRRGGIDINPIRTTHDYVTNDKFIDLNNVFKTLRQ